MSFDRRVRESQVRWRTAYLPHIPERGTFGGDEYDHILPAERWMAHVWPEIEMRLTEYLNSTGVKPHTYRNHLNSSWVLAANLFFPFAVLPGGHELLGAVLAQELHLPVASLLSVDLEFADDPPRDQATLLGETRGSRGANQTSPDVGIRYQDHDGHQCLVLIEVKYTESDFQTCSEYKKLEAGSREPCLNLAGLLNEPGSCPFTAKGREYVRLLQEPLRSAADHLANVSACPAAKGGYQLFRQQALAEALIEAGAYRQATSVVAWTTANDALSRALDSVTSDGLELGEWGELFGGESNFASLEHETLLDTVEASPGRPDWSDRWIEYMRGRYFPGQ